MIIIFVSNIEDFMRSQSSCSSLTLFWPGGTDAQCRTWTFTCFLSSHDALWPTGEFSTQFVFSCGLRRTTHHVVTRWNKPHSLSVLSPQDDPPTSTDEPRHGRWGARQHAHLLVHEWVSHRILPGTYSTDIRTEQFSPDLCLHHCYYQAPSCSQNWNLFLSFSSLAH